MIVFAYPCRHIDKVDKPKFKSLAFQVCRLCRHVEGVMGYFCSCAGLCDSRWREDLRTHVLKVNAAYSLNVPLQDICNLRIRVLKVNEAYLLHVLRHGMASVLLAAAQKL